MTRIKGEGKVDACAYLFSHYICKLNNSWQVGSKDDRPFNIFDIQIIFQTVKSDYSMLICKNFLVPTKTIFLPLLRQVNADNMDLAWNYAGR